MQDKLTWSVAACLFAVDTVLLAESEVELQRVVEKFHRMCSRKKLRVNAGKSEENFDSADNRISLITLSFRWMVT